MVDRFEFSIFFPDSLLNQALTPGSKSVSIAFTLLLWYGLDLSCISVGLLNKQSMISRASNLEIAEIALNLIYDDASAATLTEQSLSVAYQGSEAAKAEYKQAIETGTPLISNAVEHIDNLVRWNGPPEPPLVIPPSNNAEVKPNQDLSTTAAEIIRNYQLQRTVHLLYLVTNSEIKRQKVNPRSPAELEFAKLLGKILHDAQHNAGKQTELALNKLSAEGFVKDFDNLLSQNDALPVLSLPDIKLPQDIMEKEAVYARHHFACLFWRSISQSEKGPGKNSLRSVLKNTRLRFEVLDEVKDTKSVVGYYTYKDHGSLYGYSEVPRVVEGRFVEITEKNEIIVLNRNSPTGFYAVRLLADKGKDGKLFRAVSMEITDDMREDYEGDSTSSPLDSILITPANPIGELTLNPGEATAIVTGSLLNLIESIVVIKRLSHPEGNILVTKYNVPNDIEWPMADPSFPLTIDEIKGLGMLPDNEPQRKLITPKARATDYINVYANGILAGGYDIGREGKIKFVKPDRSPKPVNYSR